MECTSVFFLSEMPAPHPLPPLPMSAEVLSQEIPGWFQLSSAEHEKEKNEKRSCSTPKIDGDGNSIKFRNLSHLLNFKCSHLCLIDRISSSHNSLIPLPNLLLKLADGQRPFLS